MQPYYRPIVVDLQSGTTTYVYGTNPDGTIYLQDTLLDLSVSQDQLVGYEALSCGPLIKGNFKSPNPWNYTKSVANLGTLTESATYKTGDGSRITSTSMGSYPNPFGGDPLDYGDVDGRAFNDLTEKLYNQVRGDLDLSVSAFQAKQTAKMFNLSDQLVKYTSRRTHLIRKAGSAWLEYVYGLKPLVSDIYKAAVESLDYQQKRADTYKVQSRASQTDRIERVYSSNGGNTKVSYFTEGSTEVKYRMQCSFNLQDQSEIDRFTSLNPVSIAWELLPYSFVVDWVYDVGSYLRQAESAVLYAHRFKGGFSSRLEVTQSTYTYLLNDTYPSLVRRQNSSGNSKVVSFRRDVYLGSPFPRPPQLDVKLGAGRLLNAAGLLSQFIGSGKPSGRKT